MIIGLLLAVAIQYPAFSAVHGCVVDLPSPLLQKLEIAGEYDTGRKHYGVDYRSNGADVRAVRDGRVLRLGEQIRSLKVENPRTGLKKQGYGTYVVLAHEDGAQSLYAHLDPASVSSIKVGDLVRAGQKIGLSDSSGAVTGPHLHFEYSEKGDIFDKQNKMDPDRCIMRSGTVTLQSLTALHGGDLELSLDGRLLGNTGFGLKKAFPIAITPGPHRLIIKLLKAIDGKRGGYSLELSEDFEVVNEQGAILSAGDSQHDLAEGTSKAILINVYKAL